MILALRSQLSLGRPFEGLIFLVLPIPESRLSRADDRVRRRSPSPRPHPPRQLDADVQWARLMSAFAQVGSLITWEPLKPDLNKLNPINQFKQMFGGVKVFAEFAKSIAKVAGLGLVGYLVIMGSGRSSQHSSL